jgi:hypothetical protein
VADNPPPQPTPAGPKPAPAAPTSSPADSTTKKGDMDALMDKVPSELRKKFGF